MAHQHDGDSALWKKFIELGIFDEFYPQRVNACFRYLDVEKIQSFSLKDLMQKGVFVFNYLSLDIEHESTFAIMDIFRTFDRSGSGAVTIEDFAIGMMEKLYALHKNVALLEAIAVDVLAVENRSAELAARLDKETASSDKLIQFRIHLRSLLYLIRDRLRNPPKTTGLAVNLTSSALVGLFQDCILQAIRDSISYFHISNERLSGISLEYEILLSHPTHLADRAGTESLHHYSMSAWNLSAPRLFSTGNQMGSAATAAAVGLLPGFDSSQGALGNTAVGGGGAGGSGGLNSASLTGLPASGVGATMPASSSGLRAISPAYMSEGEDELFAHKQGGASVPRGGRKKSILALNDPQSVYDALSPPPNLVSLGIEPDALDALSGLAANNGSVDSSQLYLLQAAFRSLESFFSLADSAAVSSESAGANKSNGTAALARTGAATPLLTSDPLGVATSIAKTTTLHKNDDYLGGTLTVQEQSVPILSTGFEFDLAQNLLETQEALRKTRMRMDVLEMVQDEAMMGENSVFLDDDEDDEGELGRMGRGNAGAVMNHEYLLESGEFEETKSREFVPSRAATEEEIIQEVDMKYGNKITSFDGIMAELSTLRACLSERASVDYPLGHLLDRNVAIVALDDAHKTAGTDSGDDSQRALPPLLKAMTDTTKDIYEIVRLKTQANSTSQTTLNTIKQQEEKLAELRSQAEQAEIARNEFTSLTVELQILREKIQRHSKDEGQLNLLTVKNLELSRHVRELEEQLGDSKSRRKDANESKSDNKKIHDLRTLNQQLELQKNAQAAEAERLGKENQRLKAAMNISEQRVKGALQDQMALHHQLQQLEEDNMNAKATITKLTREMEDHKISRGHREDADRRISELQREIHKRDVELAEAREDASQALKYQNELLAAEKTIEHLEMSVGEMSVELEKGSVAMLQLDSYREQLRVKTKENRDMSLHIHGLENQLKDVPYLQTRYQEVQEELEDCKMKIEKLPGLLSEQARLRGSSRASVKALQEHDKTLSHYKNRVKQLEREAALLKNDNRAMQELEIKLKESNQEIKRLLTMIAEGNNPNKPSGAGNAVTVPGLRPIVSAAEEEKKKANANDGQYRKMRTRIRQSIAMSGATGTAGMAAAVAATMNQS